MLQRTNLKYIRVIPSLSQSRVREDKTCRLVKGQQTFFVLQNQIVSGNIVRKLAATLQLTVDTSAGLFVNTEISFVNRTYITAHRFQIFLVRSIENSNIVVEYIQVFLLEYPPIFAQDFVAICIVLTILGNFVNEEKRKGLDSHIKQLFFLLKVRKDGFPNLNPAHVRL